MGTAIQTVDLTRSFGEVTAVDGIDLSVEEGELFSLLGTNGAGKTTTIKMLCCLLRPTGGTATVMGHDITTDALRVKDLIAVSPQETAIAEHLTARENLMMMAGLHGIARAPAHERTEELLDVMALTARAEERVKRFSGGMKRRLSVAMALVSDPQVLFLDEPTIGLDPQSRRGMWEHIEGLKGDTTIVLTTHYLEEADALADRVMVVDEGRSIAAGTTTELKRQLEGAHATVIETDRITDEALQALRGFYPSIRVIDGGVEIDAEDVSVYVVGDCLRQFDIDLRAAYKRRATLDDVFLDLTGRALRQ